MAGRLRKAVAAYTDPAAADSIALLLREHGLQVRIDDPRDQVSSLQAEMRNEIDHTVAGPGNFGPFTKNMTKGIAFLVPLATMGGLVIGTLIGLVPFFGGSTALRVVIFGLSGALAGAVAGFVIGGGMSEHTMVEGDMAAERATILAVESADETAMGQAIAVIRSSRPIRLDVLDEEDLPAGTELTEDERDPAKRGVRGVVERLREPRSPRQART